MRYVTIEQWGGSYRLVYMNRKRRKEKDTNGGYNEHQDELCKDGNGGDVDNLGRDVRRAADGERLENNIIRARTRVRELVACNPWDYFATYTLDKRKQDRYDRDGFVRDFGRFIGNFNRDYSCKVGYVLVIERHKNGAFHGHGVLQGVPAGALTTNRYGYLEWGRYSQRFGFISLSPVRDCERCAAYITKYITKDMVSGGTGAGRHLYTASRGLLGKTRLCTVPVTDEAVADYEGAFCGLSWVNSGTELHKTISELSKQTDNFELLSKIVDTLNKRTDNWTDEKLLQVLDVQNFTHYEKQQSEILDSAKSQQSEILDSGSRELSEILDSGNRVLSEILDSSSRELSEILDSSGAL